MAAAFVSVAVAGAKEMGRRIVEVLTSDWQGTGWSMGAAAWGRLTGGESPSGQYLVWLAAAGGKITPVMWPRGFRAILDPLELINADGDVVARAGEYLKLGGGFVSADPAEPSSMGGAQIFYAQFVQKVDLRPSGRVPGRSSNTK